jgi:hypothetical protein
MARKFAQLSEVDSPPVPLLVVDMQVAFSVAGLELLVRFGSDVRVLLNEEEQAVEEYARLGQEWAAHA